MWGTTKKDIVQRVLPLWKTELYHKDREESAKLPFLYAKKKNGNLW